jgi:hypothetical protein
MQLLQASKLLPKLALFLWCHCRRGRAGVRRKSMNSGYRLSDVIMLRPDPW